MDTLRNFKARIDAMPLLHQYLIAMAMIPVSMVVCVGGLMLYTVATCGDIHCAVFNSTNSPSAQSTPLGAAARVDPVDRITLCLIGQKTVKASLKAPSTAKFPDGCLLTAESYSMETSPEGHRVWTISGPVDAQNGFGAMLRSTYTVEVTDLGDGNHTRSRVISIR